jgi:copper chaperone
MIELHIPAMSCGHCVRAITEAVHAVDPAAQVSTDIPQHLVRVETQLSTEAVVQQLTQAGYPPG